MTTPIRNVTHLATYGEGDNTWPMMVAVCSDGTTWKMMPTCEDPDGLRWIQIPSVPGTEFTSEETP